MRRDMFREELQKAMKFQNLWSELRQYIRVTFNTTLKIREIPRADVSLISQRRLPMIDTHDTVIQ